MDAIRTRLAFPRNDRDRFQHDSGENAFFPGPITAGFSCGRILLLASFATRRELNIVGSCVIAQNECAVGAGDVGRTLSGLREKLDGIAGTLSIRRAHSWRGYVRTQTIIDRMRAADLVVLPTLSEGNTASFGRGSSQTACQISDPTSGACRRPEGLIRCLLVHPKDARALGARHQTIG